MPEETLIILGGQEGAGKSTTVRALAAAIPWSARIDAEDLRDINPFSLDEAALHLLWKNVADLTRNYWAAGFRNVVAASFLSNFDQYTAFRAILNAPAHTYLIHLCATKPKRDIRRIERSKPSSQEWRDHIDQVDPEDTTLGASQGDYRYLRVDNDSINVSESISHIRQWAPELFAGDNHASHGP